ncbi:hypothetical protein N658DRAFT_485358 [Parathielavia hyrcaniae]|uniref:Uncharacterized protein n=1 Tax=Parathielavia hyrcaniae TaxID=113614 RepID=A0AAN6Q4A7_9PEZI|nr:hypothetical protein N658DRAFT_485358 [Parathielavia hyrcaniae]
MASPLASEPASPQTGILAGRQSTPTPETPTVDKERSKGRDLFDELTDHQAEDLTDAQRGDDNGEKTIMHLYVEEWAYWQAQLKLWRRFAKRRGQDGVLDLHDLEPVDVVAAFVTYLREHLQRDMEDRAKPGCEIWPDYSHMVFHRSFIDDVLEALPPAEALQVPRAWSNGPALKASLDFTEGTRRKKQSSSSDEANGVAHSLSKSSPVKANCDMSHQTTKNNKESGTKTEASQPANHSLRSRQRTGDESSITDATGLTRSSRIAARNSRSG